MGYTLFDEEDYAENWCRACQREKCLGQENCPDMAHAWGTEEIDWDAEVTMFRDEVFKAEKLGLCHICGQLTHYVEVNYEMHYCSQECIDEEDRRVNEAIKRSNNRLHQCCVALASWREGLLTFGDVLQIVFRH